MTPPPAAPSSAQPAVFPFQVPAPGAPIRAALAAVRALTPGPILAATAETWLTGGERERFSRFLVDHARAEFLAGRMAAKAALTALDPVFSRQPCEIVPGVWHQPTLRPEGRGWAVTLAHGGGIGLALAFDDRWLCGIDVELTARIDRAVIATLVSACERDWADAAPDPAASQARWALLWTAREALGKMLRVGIARPGLLRPLGDVDEGLDRWTARFEGADDIAVHATRTAEHVVSLVAPVTEGSDEAVGAALEALRVHMGGRASARPA